MKHEAIPMIGPLQLRIMLLAWKKGAGVTVQEMHQGVNAQGQPLLAYTTILTVMRNLAKRGVMKQTGVGYGKHVFLPLIGHDEYRARVARFVADALFEGDALAMAKAAST